MAANFPGSLPSATPATHGVVIDEVRAIADEYLTGAAWTAYVPAYTNFTATNTFARYKKVGKTVTVQMVATLTAGASGSVEFSLPVAAAASYSVNVPVGTVYGFDSSAGALKAGVAYLNVAAGRVGILSDAGVWAAAIPFAWASPDTFQASFTYEAA